MAKLIVLLCFAAVLAVALAHRARRMDRRGPPFGDVEGRDPGRYRTPAQRVFHRRGDEGSAQTAWRRRYDFLESRHGRRSHGVHRMGQPSPLKPSEQGMQRIPHQRMMDNLRADLQRFQQTGRWGEAPDISSLRDAYRRMGGIHQMDHFGGQMDLMGHRLDQRNRVNGYLNRDMWRHHRQSGRLHDTPLGFGDGPLDRANGNDMEPGDLEP